MRDIPLKTRIYTGLLLLTTALVLGVALSNHTFVQDNRRLKTAFILGLMIVLVEKFEIDFPHPSFQFSVSVGAILALACGLTLGPLSGALVVITAEVISDVWLRLKPIQVVVNATNLGLATFCGGLVYQQLARGATSPLDDFSTMAATVIAAAVYTIVNTGLLALIISPVVGDTPLYMWKANFNPTYTFVSLPALASLVPIISKENPYAILVLFVPLIVAHLAQRTLRKVEVQTQATMEGLTDALERRDPYTSRHSIRVTDFVRAILEEMPHIPASTQQTILDAARIHDLGKVGTQDSALRKPGPLTEEERLDIQQHSAIGADIVGRLESYKRIATIVRHHHERWDGKGYPDGLSGEDIPLGSRIICVADSFDAMTSDRPYRRALSTDDAHAELVKHSGTQFDPVIVTAFERALGKSPLDATVGRPLLIAAAAD
jgi:HD-GYP domain-containing protein (c-di-GMP phosphodiesterase class II)